MYRSGQQHPRVSSVLRECRVCYESVECFTRVSSVLRECRVFYESVECVTRVSSVLRECRVCYESVECFTRVSSVLRECRVFYESVECFTRVSSVLRECRVFYESVECFTRVSSVLRECRVFYECRVCYESVECFTRVSSVLREYRVFYESVECFTRVSSVLRECRVFYESVECFTRVSSVLRECRVFYESVECVMRVSSVLRECRVCYESVECVTRASSVLRECRVCYESVECVTRVSSVLRECRVFYESVECVTRVSSVLREFFVLIIITFIFLEHVLRSFKVGSYQDKYVFITGCDSGFGQGLACHLDRLGFHVFAGCLTDKGRTYLKEQCLGRLVTILLDVSKNQSIEAALQEVKRSLPEGKGLWGLVNNAGILGNYGFSEMSTREDHHKVFDVKLLGMTEMTRHFLPLIRKARGRVVNISSAVGRLATMGGAYSLSKNGVEAYSDILRREKLVRGVKVCIIEPGGFKTNITSVQKFWANILNAFAERATEEMKDCYGALEAFYAKIESSKFYYMNHDISPVVDAYTHALTSRFPKTRYSVGLDMKLFYLPMSYLPTCITDGY
ncbi:Retinol dehydrogenase 7 [Bulinus truncatus]|nr:Retinol dehydrogenase 7 [Bulinus truncatus]